MSQLSTVLVGVTPCVLTVTFEHPHTTDCTPVPKGPPSFMAPPLYSCLWLDCCVWCPPDTPSEFPRSLAVGPHHPAISGV